MGPFELRHDTSLTWAHVAPPLSTLASRRSRRGAPLYNALLRPFFLNSSPFSTWARLASRRENVAFAAQKHVPHVSIEAWRTSAAHVGSRGNRGARGEARPRTSAREGIVAHVANLGRARRLATRSWRTWRTSAPSLATRSWRTWRTSALGVPSRPRSRRGRGARGEPRSSALQPASG